MTTTSLAPGNPRRWSLPGAALLACGVLGTAWNIFGLERFAATSFKIADQLVAQGLSAAQATLYVQLPGWMTAAFAVGVVGGLFGSILLMLGRRAAVPVLGVSLAAYVALFAGDWAHGVFEAFPGQFAILLCVVGIAAGLLAAGLQARRQGLLR